MNPSCLVFAFQFSVTDFKSQRRQVQGGCLSTAAISGQKSESKGGDGRRCSREKLRITEEGAEKVRV